MKPAIYENNQYTLSLDDIAFPCKIYAVSATSDEKMVLEKNYNRVNYSVELPRGHRIFHIKDSTSRRITTACRRVELAELDNFRDMGGYAVGDKYIKWGMLYRSAVPYNLSTEAISFIEKLNIATLFDFRSKSEVDKEPDVTFSHCEYKNYSGITGLEDVANLDMASMIKDIINNKEVQNKFKEFLIGSYSEMAINPVAFKQYFQELLQNTKKAEKARPILFHCTAGKDRTGVCGALTMLALGASLETVYEDYLLSAQYIPQKILALLDTLKTYNLDKEVFTIFADLLTVKKDYLDAFFVTLNKKWGNLDNFFVYALKISKEDRDMLQKTYLEN